MMRTVVDNYGARIFDHELIAKDEVFPELLRGNHGRTRMKRRSSLASVGKQGSS
jgi:hypothetical protein